MIHITIQEMIDLVQNDIEKYSYKVIENQNAKRFDFSNYYSRKTEILKGIKSILEKEIKNDKNV